MKTWIDQHIRPGLDDFKIESFHWADAMWMLPPELNVGLGDNSWIQVDSHIFWTLYNSNISKCIQFLLAHLPSQARLDCELVCLDDSKGQRIYSNMNTGDWWWDTQYHLPARATSMPAICASDMSHMTIVSGDQHAKPLYRTIGNIWKDFHRPPKKGSCIVISLIPCPPNGAKIVDEAWHSAVGTVLSQLRHLDISGPGLKWDGADAFEQKCCPILAAWVRDYPEHVICVQIPDGSWLMCEFPKVALIRHSLFDQSTSQDTTIFIRSCCSTMKLMLCTLFVST